MFEPLYAQVIAWVGLALLLLLCLPFAAVGKRHREPHERGNEHPAGRGR